MKDSSAMCDAFKVLTNVPCASIVKPCFYKPQTVPICPFSSCKICQPKPNRCGCCKVCQQISTPPPFPFEGDPCPTENEEPIRVSPFSKPSACLKKSNSMRPSCIKMLEVHPVGRYVKLYNASLNKTECIGNWYLIQYNYGSTLSVFKFPKDAVVPPQYRIKVWSSCSDPGWLKLPTDHSFHELSFWCFGPGITTALYKPDGKPITWLVGLEKFEPAPCYITYDSPVRKISESGCKCCA